ncbi:hypothetical protein [Chroococcidiopsis cubana]|uniref:hypothetical protein n=1 Tax=Chroococcidiopsis cubana TaxID=171392 RepID=UPI001A7E2151|nr:hypothetical protein [Chroococcidiopsis cubana]
MTLLPTPPLYPVTVRIFIWLSGFIAYCNTRKDAFCLARFTLSLVLLERQPFLKQATRHHLKRSQLGNKLIQRRLDPLLAFSSSLHLPGSQDAIAQFF